MKKIKLFNITILSSTLLFISCSKTPNKEEVTMQKQLSVYNILGISEPKNNSYDSYKNKKYPLNNTSADITYISYKQPTNYQDKLLEEKKERLHIIESRAKSFLGVPYVWGATGPNKFDCSGFTQWVYRDAGIDIPRVSKNQARVGEFVRYENLKRGDMVFFDTKKKRTGLVNHVGIYLGSDNFIHASSKGKGVVIYNFEKEKFYKKRFLWGRRVIEPNFHYTLK